MKIEEIFGGDEIIDVLVILDGAKFWEDYFLGQFSEKVNKIYFSPESTHSHSRRKQDICGELNPSRKALIFDDCFYSGNSCKEIYNFLKQNGYNEDNIFIFYAEGYANRIFARICEPIKKFLDKTLPEFHQKYGTK